jgi:jumonji domain-containing protein 7
MFVKPLEYRMPISEFLQRMKASQVEALRNASDPDMQREVLYLQSQDGNIYRSEPRYDGWGGSELKVLQNYVERDVHWMSEALGESSA